MTRKEKLILLGKLIFTSTFLILLSVDFLCKDSKADSAQISTIDNMAKASIAAFYVYWILWLLWDEEAWAKNQKLHRILFFLAAGLSVTKFLYMHTLCN